MMNQMPMISRGCMNFTLANCNTRSRRLLRKRDDHSISIIKHVPH